MVVVEPEEDSQETSPLLPKPSQLSQQQMLQQLVGAVALNLLLVAVAGLLVGGALALGGQLPFLKAWAAGTLVCLAWAAMSCLGL